MNTSPITHKAGRRAWLLSLLVAMSALSAAETTAAGNAVPKVVVNILIDQLRSDYLDAFMPLYAEGGFKKLLAEGRVYRQAEYPLLHPDRASAAATLATGTSPSNHGIVGLRWLDRTTLRPLFCVDDPNCKGLPAGQGLSPCHLGVSTTGDELKVASEGKALVYSIAPFSDAAILAGGHSADGVVWIDDRTGMWSSSSYYGGLPVWANVRNRFHNLSDRLKSTTWKPSSELVGNFSYFLSGGMKRPFAHTFKGDDRFVRFKTSGLVNEEVTALAKDCLSNTLIGQDAISDYLNLTFYAAGFNHATAAAAPMELQDTYVRLDAALADLITAVEQKVGRENALFVLTSTGYTDETDADLSAYRIPTGLFDMQKASALLDMYLSALYGQGRYVEAVFGTQVYLNHKLLEEKSVALSDVLLHTQDFLLQLAGVKDVYTSQRLLQGAWTPGISRIRNGYNVRCSGDLTIEIAPGWHYVNSGQREKQYVRESYIPFPIIFYGYGLPAEEIGTPVTIDYIAPTLTKAMRIRAPNACATAPLF
ncbi:MAG: alkaline phosphatase family protein [Alloprevotella sp.]